MGLKIITKDFSECVHNLYSRRDFVQLSSEELKKTYPEFFFDRREFVKIANRLLSSTSSKSFFGAKNIQEMSRWRVPYEIKDSIEICKRKRSKKRRNECEKVRAFLLKHSLYYSFGTQDQVFTVSTISLRVKSKQVSGYLYSPEPPSVVMVNQNDKPQLLEACVERVGDRKGVLWCYLLNKPYENKKALKKYNVGEDIRDSVQECTFYTFRDYLYYFDNLDIHTRREQELLVQEHYFKEEKRFNKLRKEIQLFKKLENLKSESSREPIPEEVRFAVWRRDGGKCVKCGSRKRLEFDHIIPLSKGGSNTERNIQLLCEKCNREKSNKI